MLTIDGSIGEGGGQILRSSLALSMATQTPFRIHSIRAGREKPGLMRQHLTCVLAAAEICGASVQGASVGSTEVSFAPGPVRAGNYHFAIGTAGGTTLVLQALLPALLRASGPSTLAIEGGTHCKAAPPFEFFERTLAPLFRRCGAGIAARLERFGFYPAGGGRIVIEITPPGQAVPLELHEAGSRMRASATALISRLSVTIAQRELAVLGQRLSLLENALHVVEVRNSVGQGNAAMVELVHEHVTEIICCAGERGLSSEQVANTIVDEARKYISRGLPVGEHLCDQLMLPLAMLAGGSYRTGPLSEHSRTNMLVLDSFGVKVEYEPSEQLVRVKKL